MKLSEQFWFPGGVLLLCVAGFSLRGSLRPKRKPRERRFSPRDARKVHVTVSIGVAELSDKLGSPQVVIEAADRALYRAKQEGRNQAQSA